MQWMIHNQVPFWYHSTRLPSLLNNTSSPKCLSFRYACISRMYCAVGENPSAYIQLWVKRPKKVYELVLSSSSFQSLTIMIDTLWPLTKLSGSIPLGIAAFRPPSYMTREYKHTLMDIKCEGDLLEAILAISSDSPSHLGWSSKYTSSYWHL